MTDREDISWMVLQKEPGWVLLCQYYGVKFQSTNSFQRANCMFEMSEEDLSSIDFDSNIFMIDLQLMIIWHFQLIQLNEAATQMHCKIDSTMNDIQMQICFEVRLHAEFLCFKTISPWQHWALITADIVSMVLRMQFFKFRILNYCFIWVIFWNVFLWTWATETSYDAKSATLFHQYS